MNKTTDTLHLKRHLPVLVLLLTGAFFLSGCNTVAGVGEDMEAAGDAIEDKAEEHKDY